MTEDHPRECRYFVTYTGVKLPSRLVNPLEAGDMENRNTFIRGYFDAEGRLTGFQRVVYGEVELEHKYAYHDNGALRQAEVSRAGDDVTVVHFDREGKPLTT